MWNVGVQVCLLFVRREILFLTLRSHRACLLMSFCLHLEFSGADLLIYVLEAWLKVTVYLKVNSNRPAHAATE